jgi:hypothetical protein
MAVQITKPTPYTVMGKFSSFSGQDIFQIVGSDGSIICSLNSKGLFNPTFIPIVQNSLLAINTNAPQSVSNQVIATSLFNIALFMESYGNGQSGTTCTAIISWTNAQGNTKTVSLVLVGNTDNIQQENYAFLAKAGSTITVSTSFSGAPFNYDIAAAIAILPTAGGA